jgi:serine/threonine-protein kinase
VVATLGEYELLGRIAAGGMAEVFVARKTGPEGFEKRVALKRILPHLSDHPTFVHLFLEEARLAARLEHPHIVQIHDFGRDGDTYYLALQLVVGQDLQSIFRRSAETKVTVAPADAAMLLLQACEGLHHAHELGIVHRDVTPANLLVSYEGMLKVADFGIAKAEASLANTQPRGIRGKLAYLSPEQARGEPVDRRTDVYSLGLCLWELITGRRLHDGERDDLQLLDDVRAGRITPPSSVRPIDPGIEEILMRALEHDRDRRWPTARAFGEALAGWLASSGEVASPARLAAWMSRLYGPDAAVRARSIQIPREPTVPLALPETRRRRRRRSNRGMMPGHGGTR